MIRNIVLIFAILGGSIADPVDQSELPEKLTIPMRYRSADGTSTTSFDMLPTETFLANIHTPVWLAKSETPTELTSLDHIMQDIGPFTVYSNAMECSTALYFHKKKQFEGTIANQFHIQGLKYDPITKTAEISPDVLSMITLPDHNKKLRKNVVEEGKKFHLGFRSLAAFPDTVYIEALVMVYYDLTTFFESDYEAIVTHVLTVFNTADMLYSRIEKPKIKLNIAGIIIAEKKGSMQEVRNCHQIVMASDSVKYSFNADCVYGALDTILARYNLPLESFDVVVFLSSATLSRIPLVEGQKNYFGEAGSLLGLTRYTTPKGHFRESLRHTGIALVTDAGDMDCFPILAHEIAHLLGVPHDGGRLWTEDGRCSANLMRTDASFCRKCIVFGGKSPMHFERFFGGSRSCIFRNKPRSLENPRGPRFDRDTNDQCECYGFMSVVHQPSISVNARPDEPILDCEARLKCLFSDRTTHITTFYADGTPCSANREKVCWNKQCLPVVQNA